MFSHSFPTQCSAECGTGKMKREVLCFYGDQVATLSDCDEGSKPITDQPCNMEACDDGKLSNQLHQVQK